MVVLMPPLALKPALCFDDLIVSNIMLAASGVAEIFDFPVDVFKKLTPASKAILEASQITDADLSSPVSKIILSVFSLHNKVVV